MSGPEAPGSPPPEVPEDYLAAYNEAYQRALGEASAPEPASVPAAPIAPPQRPASRSVGQTRPRPGWLPVALLAGLALVLVLGAYGVGRLFSGGTEASPQDHRESPAPAKPSKSQATSPEHVVDAWEGEVVPVQPTDARATCRARPSVDSAGQPVRYGAMNTLDGDPSTAWRCTGPAIGERLQVTLPAGTEVAEVGIIPGYAKTDPASGTDRYAENNRITRVRWTIGDGVVVVQRLDPDPKNRDVQMIRVPATRTDSVTLEILAVAPGTRNTTAISELVAAAADD